MDSVKEIKSIYNSKVGSYVSNNKIWLAIFGGAVAAIAIAAILYPEKSKELLNKATDSATDLAGKIGSSASDLASKIGDSASSYAERIKETATEYAGDLKNSISSENLSSIAKKAKAKKESLFES